MKKFIIFGKIAWKYILNIGEGPWESNSLDTAIKKKSEILNREVFEIVG